MCYFIEAMYRSEHVEHVPARPQTGVTLTATDGRLGRLELPYVFQCSKEVTIHRH